MATYSELPRKINFVLVNPHFFNNRPDLAIHLISINDWTFAVCSMNLADRWFAHSDFFEL